MRALVWHGSGDVRHESVPDPTIVHAVESEAHHAGLIGAYDKIKQTARIESAVSLLEQIAEQRKRTQQDELAEELTLRLDQNDGEALTKFAKRKGIGPSTLARMCIREHLEAEAARDAKAS